MFVLITMEVDLDQDFIDRAVTLLEELPNIYIEDCSTALLHAELLYRDFALLFQDGKDDESMAVIMEAVRNVVSTLCELMIVEVHQTNAISRRGRPAIPIPEEILRFLLEQNFQIKDIANMLLLSPKTISRRVFVYGLEGNRSYTVHQEIFASRRCARKELT
jgi:hypothetical protein